MCSVYVCTIDICSMMRGRIKGTDSTINAILATAVLYELQWKIWHCAGKIQFVIKTDLRGVAGGDGELGCLCGKAGTSHLCDGSAHSSGCVVNGSNAMAAV